MPDIHDRHNDERFESKIQVHTDEGDKGYLAVRIRDRSILNSIFMY